MNAYLVWSKKLMRDIKRALADFTSNATVVSLMIADPNNPTIGICDLYIIYTDLSGVQLSHLEFCKAYRDITHYMQNNPCIITSNPCVESLK